MDATFKLREPLKIDETYDQVFYLGGSVLFSKWESGQPIYSGSVSLQPFRIENDRRIYAPQDRVIEVRILDIEKAESDPLREDARQKLRQAHGLMQMAANVVKGAPAG